MFELTVEALLVAIAVIAALASGTLFGLYWGGPGRHGSQQEYDGVFRYLQVVAERLRQRLISESEAARLCHERFLEYAKLAGGTDLSGNTRIAHAALIAGGVCALSLVGLLQLGPPASAVADQAGGSRLEAAAATTVAGTHARAAGKVDRRLPHSPAPATRRSRPQRPDGPTGSGSGAAIASLVERLHRSPHEPEIWRMLGRSHLRAGNYAKAMEAYERALQLTARSRGYRAGSVRTTQEPDDAIRPRRGSPPRVRTKREKAHFETDV